MRVDLRLFNIHDQFLHSLTVGEGTSKEDRKEAILKEVGQEYFNDHVEYWYIDDRARENKEGEIQLVDKSKSKEILQHPPGERIYHFTRNFPPEKEGMPPRQMEEHSYESELTEEQKSILYGEFLQKWAEMPLELQKKFIEQMNDFEKKLIEEFGGERPVMIGIPMQQEWIKTPNVKEGWTGNGWIDSNGNIFEEEELKLGILVPMMYDKDGNLSEAMLKVTRKVYSEKLSKQKK